MTNIGRSIILLNCWRRLCEACQPEDRLRVVDMGSGKGYLTFATYAFLKQEGYNAEVVGIERRRALVDLCNRVAAQCEFGGLRFEVGEISGATLDDRRCGGRTTRLRYRDR